MFQDSLTFPLSCSVGSLPLMTVGEFGANFVYLGKIFSVGIGNQLFRAFFVISELQVATNVSLKAVEICKCVANTAGVDDSLQVVHLVV